MLDRMFGRFDDRSLEIATVVVVILIALVILCYSTIIITPNVFFNPFAPPLPTEVGQTTPDLEPTWTPSPTATATDTSTPTPTWTPTLTPTNTPTPTPTPTQTPSPVPTNTPKPTRKPRPPKPTPTPTPFPYYYESAGGRADCTRTWVHGYVLGANGLPEPNVQIRVGNNQGWHGDAWTDVEGYYAFEFAKGPQAGRWYVRVFKGGQPRSMQFWWETSGGCEGPYSLQEVEIIWRHQ